MVRVYHPWKTLVFYLCPHIVLPVEIPKDFLNSKGLAGKESRRVYVYWQFPACPVGTIHRALTRGLAQDHGNNWMVDNGFCLQVSLMFKFRWLRLSIPNTIMWIAGFYSFFHVFLNIIAELLTFADRKFYMDWWNCRSLEEYWKTWNLPVHFWFIRHMYNPLLKKGFSKNSAMVLVFLISALAHEFMVCVPLHLISYYAFLAMLLQAPTIYLEKKLQKLLRLKNSELGNASFWLFFCIMGQPICVFIYYSLYMTK